MNAFNYRDGELFAEGVALSAIAERHGAHLQLGLSQRLGGTCASLRFGVPPTAQP